MTLAMTRAIERSSGHLYTFVDGEGRHGPYPGATAITSLQDSTGGSDGLLTWAVNLALDEVQRHAAVRPEDWPIVRAAALAAKNRPRDIGTDWIVVPHGEDGAIRVIPIRDPLAEFSAVAERALRVRSVNQILDELTRDAPEVRADE